MSDTPRTDALLTKWHGEWGADALLTLTRQLERELNAARPEVRDTVSVPRSLAERTEAMFRSVDPEGSIAQEWRLHMNSRPDSQLPPTAAGGRNKEET